MKEKENTDKYLDFAWGLKWLLNTKVLVIPSVFDALETISKDLKKTERIGNQS